jgi:hypothetical protein
MAYADTWHVRSRGRECNATGRPFSEGEVIVTALFPDPEPSGYLRKDFSEQGWSERSADDERPFSFWRSVYSAPGGVEKDDPVKKLSAEEVLRRLCEEDEDHTENTRYILALMLERQRLLRETDNQRTADGILRVYEQRKTGEVFIVKDPDLPLDQVEAVQNEVIVLLENNGRLPGAPAPDPAQAVEAVEPQAAEETDQPETLSDPAPGEG